MLALCAWGSFYATQIEPANVQIVRLTVTLPRLDEEFRGYKIVQISDIHYDNWMTAERLAGIVQQVNNLQPDLVLITGDFSQGSSRVMGLVEILRDLTPRQASLAVMGNRDYWSNRANIRQIISSAGIIELSNRVYTIQRGRSFLHIAGLDDVIEKKNDLNQILKQLPPTGASIIMVHEPDYADTVAQTGRFGLQLSGHSHGGQVVLPFVGAPIRPNLGRKYPTGLYRVQDMLLYTNRGLGMAFPQVRFNCPPEITLLTLTP